ncbi:MAG: zinc ribbon domain-containing protein [Acidobacteria bacterium]|nr:zinc ribbon domain-containing protein [Acidobacteriota bacterium]
MPLYEYRCTSCGDMFEIIQKFSDAPVETCSKCGGQVRKLLSSSAIQFKGSGWYVTDYSRAGNGRGSQDGSKPARESDSREPSGTGGDSPREKQAEGVGKETASAKDKTHPAAGTST